MPLEEHFCPSLDDSRTLCIIDHLAKSGVGILLLGEDGAGKSALLRHAVAAEQFSAVKYISNGGDVPIEHFEFAVRKSLTRRKPGWYGPPVGKTLTVCVDDVHMQQAPIASQTLLFTLAYIQSRGRWCGSDVGLVKLLDTVAVGTATSVPSSVARYFVCLKLKRSLDSSRQCIQQALRAALSPTPHPLALAECLTKLLLHAYDFCLKEQLDAQRASTVTAHAAQSIITLLRAGCPEGMLLKYAFPEIRRNYSVGLNEEARPRFVRFCDVVASQVFTTTQWDPVNDSNSGNAVVVYEEQRASRMENTELMRSLRDWTDKYNAAPPMDLALLSPSQDTKRSSVSYRLAEEEVEESSVQRPPRVVLTPWIVKEAMLLYCHLQQPQTQIISVATVPSVRYVWQVVSLCFFAHGIAISRSSEPAEYTRDAFLSDVRTCFQCALGKRTVGLFVSPKMLAVPGVLGDVDRLLRTHFIPGAFRSDELVSIYDTLKLEEKSEASITFATRVALYLRVVVCYYTDEEMIASFVLYPGLRSLLYHRFSSWEDQKELVGAVMDILQQSSATEDHAESVARRAVEMHERLSSLGPVTIGQLMATAHIFRRTYTAKLSAALHSKEQQEVISDITRTLATDRDRQVARKSALAPQLVETNAQILETEKEIDVTSASIEQTKAAFKVLEEKTIYLVGLLEGKKHNLAQLVDGALQQLNTAKRGISEADPRQLTALRLTVVPPQKVKTLVEAVCVVLGEKLDRGPGRPAAPDYWTVGRRLMEDPGFTDRLVGIDVATPGLPTAEKLRSFVEALESVRFTNVSQFTQSLADFVIAVYNLVETKVKSDALEQQIQEGKDQMFRVVEELEQKRDELAVAVRALSEKRINVDRLRTQRETLTQDIIACTKRLDNAICVAALVERLVSVRPKENVANPIQVEALLAGNQLMAACAVSYVVAMPKKVQERAMAICQEAVEACGYSTTSPLDGRSCFSSSQDSRVLHHVSFGMQLPPLLHLSLSAMASRALSQWPLLITTSTFLCDIVEQQLAELTEDSSSVSYTDPIMQEALCSALTRGVGIVIRDFYGVVPLCWRRLLELPLQLQQTREHDTVPITLYGRKLQVKRSFLHVRHGESCRQC